MPTESILRLKIAFANIPMKGLFFWEALLYLNDEEFKKIVEEKFTKTTESLPNDEAEDSKYYQNILEDLKGVRKEILTNQNTKDEVEAIREALISETVHETTIDEIKKELAD